MRKTTNVTPLGVASYKNVQTAKEIFAAIHKNNIFVFVKTKVIILLSSIISVLVFYFYANQFVYSTEWLTDIIGIEPARFMVGLMWLIVQCYIVTALFSRLKIKKDDPGIENIIALCDSIILDEQDKEKLKLLTCSFLELNVFSDYGEGSLELYSPENNLRLFFDNRGRILFREKIPDGEERIILDLYETVRNEIQTKTGLVGKVSIGSLPKAWVKVEGREEVEYTLTC